VTVPAPPPRPVAPPRREPEPEPDLVVAARERLVTLDGLPVGDHAAVYAAVATMLGDALSDIDGSRAG
jgi:hypothetical protein